MIGTSRFNFAWLAVDRHLLSSSPLWLFLFNAGDSFQFVIIAMLGYAHGRYPFLPGYPLTIHFVGLLIGDYWLAAFLVTQIFALGSVVMFQLLAEQYMERREAMWAATLLSTFPYIFVFTTLGYSEALYLFSTISTWYFYRTGRLRTSSLCAALASITRIYGVGIVLPVTVDLLKKGDYRKLVYIAVPSVALFSWALFCYKTTGNPFISLSEEYTVYPIVGLNINFVQVIWMHLTQGTPNASLDPAVLLAFVLLAVLAGMIWQLDRALWAYTITMFVALALVASSAISLLRFMSFIFPLWLTVKVKHPVAVAICLAFLIPISLLLWLYAITVFFVG